MSDKVLFIIKAGEKLDFRCYVISLLQISIPLAVALKLK